MSLTIPSALFLLALALPIIGLYILKVRLRQIPVSTNLFWQQIYDEKPPRSLWQRFRNLASLLAQLLLLVLMVLALADPFFSWQSQAARRMVAIIDTSASMRATDVSPDRFTQAIEQAKQLVAGMRLNDKLAIVTTGHSPQVVLGMSDHGPTLRQTLDAIEVTDNPSELSQAIQLAKQLVGEHKNGQISVFSDGCVSDWPAAVEASDVTIAKPAADNESATKAEIQFHRIGSKAGNIGITQFQVRRSLVDMLGYEVLVAVSNASEQAVECRLEIELSGSPVDVFPLKLEPHESWSRSIEKTSLEGGTLVAQLTKIERVKNELVDDQESKENVDNLPLESQSVNSLSVDDTAWAILPEQKVQNVLIVTPGNLFLRKVFEANPLISVNVTNQVPEKWPADTLFVLHQQDVEKLPPGDVFVVSPATSCDQWELGNDLDNPIVTQIDSESPLMTHVRLDNVIVPAAKQLRFTNPTQILAGALSGDAIYAQFKRPTGKGLVLSVDLDQSDLAFRTTFPIMVTNALNWFAGSSGGLTESIATGQMEPFDINSLPPNTNEVTFVSPAEQKTIVTLPQAETDGSEPDWIAPASVLLGPFDRCGLWDLQTESKDDETELDSVATFAVNLANQRETNLVAAASILEIAKPSTVLSSWLARPVWYYLVAIVCLLLVAEWLLYQRRVLT